MNEQERNRISKVDRQVSRLDRIIPGLNASDGSLRFEVLLAELLRKFGGAGRNRTDA
jgi:hypothetical protein